MRRNRKVSNKMSVVAKTTMRFGAIIILFFVMAILNVLSSSNCTQLRKVKGELEAKEAKLDGAIARESSRWEEMLKPERVERALRGSGLPMKPPKPHQVVSMNSNGLPRPGQMSVAAARKRSSTMSIGVATDTASSPTRYSSKYARRKVKQ